MFEEYPKEIILRDGTGVTLRPLREDDGDLLRALYESLTENDRWFLGEKMDEPEPINEWIVNALKKKAISIVAVLEGQFVGHATLRRQFYGSRSHVGKIRISVAPAFRERHLGTWMLFDLNNIAISMGLELLVMLMVEGRDKTVMTALEKLEFSKETVIEEYLRDKEGNPQNLVIMMKRLHPGWGT